MVNSPSKIVELVKLELSSIAIKSDPDSLLKYGKDWIDFFVPKAAVILFPKSTDEVAEIILFANKHLIPVVPSGGRTGLSGGATACNNEIVISLEKLNRILAFESVEGSINVEAGVITQAIQDEADKNGFYFPIDFASKGSSQIGGNIATNAGGIHVIKYGMTRNWVLGLTVVTGDGKILKLNHGLIKNATGYDFRHLFIGSEGTLGIITEATINLIKQPENVKLILLSVQKIEYLTLLFERFKKIVDLRAFEFFDRKSLSYSLDFDFSGFPLKKEANAYAIIEFEETSFITKDTIFNALNDMMNQQLYIEEIYVEQKTEIERIWKFRENISASLTKFTPYKNDLSVRISLVPYFIKELDEILLSEYSEFEVVWFGHIGDGNIHINILKPDYFSVGQFQLTCEKVNHIIVELIKKYHGSISAEHGVGLLKKDFLLSSRSAEEINYMKQIKKVFDPNTIMNPNKIFYTDERH